MDFYDFVPVASQSKMISTTAISEVSAIPKLMSRRSELDAQLARAKSKKTKTSLSRQINELSRQIEDLQRLKNKMDAEALIQTQKNEEIEAVPGGSQTDVVIDSKPVKVEEETKKDPLLESSQPISAPEQPNKKPNYLLWGGIAAVGIIAVVFILRKK